MKCNYKKVLENNQQLYKNNSSKENRTINTNNVDSNTTGGVIKIDNNVPLINMRHIYMHIISKYAKTPERCPGVLVLPNKTSTPNALHLFNDINRREIIIIYANSTKEANKVFDKEIKKSFVFDSAPSTGLNIMGDKGADYYVLIDQCVFLSNILKTYCPQVYLICISDEFNGYASQNADNKTTQILICPNSIEIMCIALAHEMRHLWQHYNHHQEYSSSYKLLKDDTSESFIEYFKQPAEFDADAFAYAYLRYLVYNGKAIKYDRTDDESLNSSINDSSDKLYQDLFETFQQQSGNASIKKLFPIPHNLERKEINKYFDKLFEG